MQNKRIDYIDTLKGILIILVVFGHTEINTNIQKWIYSFHMPLFIIISGFFYKEQKNIINLKRIKRLVLPFILFSILAIIFPGFPLLILKNQPIEWSKIFYLEEKIFFNIPIWFLIVLFFIEIKINIINKISKHQNIKILMLIVLQILVIKFCPVLPFGLRLALSLGTTFYVGVIWRDEISLFSYDKKFGNIIILILLPISCFLGYFLGRVDLYKMKFSDSLICYYIISIINLVLWIEISKKLEKIYILKILGQDTLLILGIHYYILFFLRASYKILRLNDIVVEKIGLFFIEGFLTIIISYILIKIKEKFIKSSLELNKIIIRGKLK